MRSNIANNLYVSQEFDLDEINIDRESSHVDIIEHAEKDKQAALIVENTEVVKPNLNVYHAHKRDADICRHPDESLHIYLYKGKPVKASGTEFKKNFFPLFDADKVIAGLYRVSKCETETYKSCRGSEYDGKTRKEIAEMFMSGAEKGTDVHFCCEKYIDFVFENPDTLKKYTYNQKIETYLKPNNIIAQKYKRLIHYGRRFVSLIDEYLERGWKPYRTEWIIYDETIDLAGCIDAVFWRTNKMGQIEYRLVDWKTAKSDIRKIWGNKYAYFPINHLANNKVVEYSVQLQLYAYILKTRYNILINDIYMVVFYPDDKEEIPAIPIDIAALIAVYVNNQNLVDNTLRWFKDGECSNFQFPKFPMPPYFEKN